MARSADLADIDFKQITMATVKSSPEESIKNALAVTTKAISADRETEVTYSLNEPNLTGKNVELASPPKNLPDDFLINNRGLADAFALKLAHHDEVCHQNHQPKDSIEREIFEVAETVRVEAIGSNAMAGVAKNLKSLIVKRCKDHTPHDNISEDTPPPALAVGLLIQEYLTGEPLPNEAQQIADIWRERISEKSKRTFDLLQTQMEDQQAYAETVKHLIHQLLSGSSLVEEFDEDSDESDTPESPNDSESEGEEESEGMMQTTDTQDIEDIVSEDENVEVDAELEFIEDEGDEDEPDSGKAPIRPSMDNQNDPNFQYKVYSRTNDELVHATELCESEELVRLRKYIDHHLDSLHGVVSRLANRLQRLLLAQQNRWWSFDLEEGVLDTSRLTRVITDPTVPLSFMQEEDSDFQDTVVTMLIDNSGSMRGRPIMIAALCADVLARTLERCRVQVEILGFTTKAWKGGQTRQDWLNAGKPGGPGRLNDLRHIIYKSADAPWRRSRKNLGLMMKEGLLKENIDGEALLWAHDRLIARHEQRKILMVISDGAPVDDSTLSVNVPNYLERHLSRVIKFIEKESRIELLAIGIGHDVTRHYERAVTILDAEQLGGAMIEQLAHLFSRDTLPSPEKFKSFAPKSASAVAETRVGGPSYGLHRMKLPEAISKSSLQALQTRGTA